MQKPLPWVALMVLCVALRGQATPQFQSGPGAAIPVPAPAPLLLVSGTTVPGDWLRLDLSGAPALLPTWLAWAHTPGLTELQVGGGSSFSLALQWPVFFTSILPTDAAGRTSVAIPINSLLAPDYLHGLAFHFQLISVEPAFTVGPPWLFHVSNAGQATDQHREAEEWSALKAAAIADLQVAPGWGVPVLLQGSVNSIGWEDSAAISENGQTLYFAYIPCDLISWRWTDEGRFDRFNRHRRGPTRGVYPEYSLDTLVASGSGSSFGAPSTASISLNTNPIWQSEVGAVSVDGSLWYCTNASAAAGGTDTDIYRDGIRQSFCTSADENDPSCVGDELVFWSGNFGGPSSGFRIFQTFLSQGSWSAPVPLASPVNFPETDSWQPHLTAAGWLYFSSNRAGSLGVWVCERLGTNAWSTPVPVVWTTPGSAAVGVAEPSLTADGQWLYFCVLFRNSDGAFDLDIACSRRL